MAGHEPGAAVQDPYQMLRVLGEQPKDAGLGTMAGHGPGSAVQDPYQMLTVPDEQPKHAGFAAAQLVTPTVRVGCLRS